MGLELTDSIATSKGESTTTYLFISEYYVNKAGHAQFPIKTYFSKQEREANINDTVQTFALRFRYDMDLTKEELAAESIYTVAYGKIKAILESEGHTVVDEFASVTSEPTEESVITEEPVVIIEPIALPEVETTPNPIEEPTIIEPTGSI
jgi:hypothetical protein